MRRVKMVNYLHSLLKSYESSEITKIDADNILHKLEAKGMKPPRVDSDVYQALVSVYCYPNEYQWDDKALADEAVVKVLKRWRKEK